MLSLIFFFNLISHPSDGFNIVNTQFFADVLDVCVNYFFIAHIIVVPYPVQEVIAGELNYQVQHFREIKEFIQSPTW